MCAVVDPPLFLAIFKTSHQKNPEFGLLKDWFLKGCGKVIVGGTQYNRELAKVGTVLGFLRVLEQAGRVIKFEKNKVDDAATFAVNRAASTDFDDPHLIALVSVSGCRIICLDDPRAHKFIKRQDLYYSGVRKPKIYSGAKNSSLLNRRYMAPCCN